MESLLVKIIAAAIALGQVTSSPNDPKTSFDPLTDQDSVVSIVRDGCSHLRQVFKIEDVDLDDLIRTVMQDPDANAGANAAFRGIRFADVRHLYDEFCTDTPSPASSVDLGEVIRFYNRALENLPDAGRLRGLQLPGATVIVDADNQRFAETFEVSQHRITVPLSDIPEQVRKAFVSAEDKRFFQHHGIDERGLLRAAIVNLGQPGRPQGASTITQQVVKNLLVGDDVSYERKIREIILASRLENSLTKEQILELYLNMIYLGRGAWGVEMAAHNYFGKSAKDLNVFEGAFLAALAKGPSYFSPDRYPERIRERLTYVFGRLQEDGVITSVEAATGVQSIHLVAPTAPAQRDLGSYFADQASREARTLAALKGLHSSPYIVHSTINARLQRRVEEALQDGLSTYERNSGRVRFEGPETNIAVAVQAASTAPERSPPWQRALQSARLPLYDVHWTPAVVLDGVKGADGTRRAGLSLGLADGRMVALTGADAITQSKLSQYDVIFVRPPEGKAGGRAELRVRPEVQGAAVVLENKSGRILAMAGGFSYPLSQLNRITQAQRQPGSAIKPLSYLAALESGQQPNSLVPDEPITLPPINGGKDSWSPKNYDGRSSGLLTLRQALENSRNLATVHLLEGGIEAKPEQSLDRLCALAVEMRVYRECAKYYPFVLGAQPLRPLDLAAFYAAIANEGSRPTPHSVDAIEQDGNLYRSEAPPAPRIDAARRAAFYQLKTMMQGVLKRGTASALAGLSPYVAGKTGTTEDENDAWFVGFTNEVTVAVWVGYDNASGHRTLGDGVTGSSVALPIFENIIRSVWANGIPRTALAAPSAEARRRLSCSKDFTECMRLDEKGRPIDAQYRLVKQEQSAGRSSAEHHYQVRTHRSDYYNRDNRNWTQGQWSQPVWGGWGGSW
jgi:membrane carboxypeptidase/penicillin-binding protein